MHIETVSHKPLIMKAIYTLADLVSRVIVTDKCSEWILPQMQKYIYSAKVIKKG